MILLFERSGGFTAIPLRLKVDTKDLDSQESKMLQSQVAAADFFNLPGRENTTGRGYDRFIFKLTVQNAKQNHTVEYGDSSIPEPLQPLIDQLSAMARSKRAKE